MTDSACNFKEVLYSLIVQVLQYYLVQAPWPMVILYDITWCEQQAMLSFWDYLTNFSEISGARARKSGRTESLFE